MVQHTTTMAYTNTQRQKGIYIHQSADFRTDKELLDFATHFQRSGYKLIVCEPVGKILKAGGLPVIAVEAFKTETGTTVGDALAVSATGSRGEKFISLDILVVGGQPTSAICSGYVRRACQGKRIVLTDRKDQKPLTTELTKPRGVRVRHRAGLLIKAANAFCPEEIPLLIEMLLPKSSESESLKEVEDSRVGAV